MTDAENRTPFIADQGLRLLQATGDPWRYLQAEHFGVNGCRTDARRGTGRAGSAAVGLQLAIVPEFVADEQRMPAAKRLPVRVHRVGQIVSPAWFPGRSRLCCDAADGLDIRSGTRLWPITFSIWPAWA